MTTVQITATKVEENHRLAMLPKYFGRHLGRAERLVYTYMRHISKDYDGGLWEFYELSNGGFYMAPESPETMALVVENSFDGTMSADAAGLIATLMAISSLGFTTRDSDIAALYLNVEAYALQHSEGNQIARALN
jgi:hypothetical protein